MRRTFYASTFALFFFALVSTTSAQTAPNAASLPLPTADAVLTVDVRALLTEVLPRALASDKARLAQVNADVDEFKARTGIDAREFDSLLVGARIVPLPSGATKIDRVTVLAVGRFRAEALVAAARTAAKGGLTEQTHGGKKVYVAAVNDQVKLFGLARVRLKELAFAVLGPNLLALGEPEDVRAAIDAQAGRGRADVSLLNFPKGPNDFIGFAGNVPAGVLTNVDTGISANVDRAVASIRGFYGGVGSTPAGLQMMTTLRTGTAGDAKQLFDVANALKQMAPSLIMLAGEKWAFAGRLAESMKVTTKGNEVQLRLEVPQADISTVLKSL
jgi:hypothetical protein